MTDDQRVRSARRPRPSTGGAVEAVVFDLGGVLVDWDPRHLYRRLLADDAAVEAFLAEIGFDEWNHRMDSGERRWDEAVAELSERFPHHRELIASYPARFLETLAGPVRGTLEVLDELHRAGRVRLLALTNWSAETFRLARDELDFLHRFEAVVVSGEERVAKPDPAIFGLLVDRHGLDPETTLLVDDREVNVAAAVQVGMQGHVFTSPAALREELTRLGLLRDDAPG